MTSSVTLPFDSYWWSFGTVSLSPVFFEIFNGEFEAIVDMTLNDL